MALTTTITASGLVPRDPADIQADIVARVSKARPGYTANVPGSMVDDIIGTDVAAVTLMEQARVDTINSLTSPTAQPYILNQMAIQLGIQPGTTTNGSVDVVASNSTPGFVFNKGFIVSDGSKQYVLTTPTAVRQDGTTGLMNFVCQTAGTFAIPAGTVTIPVTPLPNGITVKLTNPQDGVPGAAQEDIAAFRARVLETQRAVSQGFLTTLRTSLQQVPGVSSRLISIAYTGSDTTAGYRVIVGGGDDTDVATAIFTSMFDIPALMKSADNTRNVVVNIRDGADTYPIPFVRPLQQNVGVTVTWNTLSGNVINNDAIAQTIQPAVLNYINGILVGGYINENTLRKRVTDAMATVIPEEDITRLVFGYTINGQPVAPASGEQEIRGNAEGYFVTSVAAISVVRG
ncbi:baseplate J/gp47 family protein [Burkholderia cenocepacia]|uniref:baseplate J/gp47 family protein n=1 Tax=Burkholderia cenocepacia TaxID=95486 RepID=UPI000981E1A0|nr:baseplate J/gp47 family protein [Burkholderia cenocepacia]MBR8264982.1 baseplate J/gp47 family protein [Burkholderia cenocepacia]